MAKLSALLFSPFFLLVFFLKISFSLQKEEYFEKQKKTTKKLNKKMAKLSAQHGQVISTTAYMYAYCRKRIWSHFALKNASRCRTEHFKRENPVQHDLCEFSGFWGPNSPRSGAKLSPLFLTPNTHHFSFARIPGRNYIRPPPLPSFLAKRHFPGERGGGVYFEAPRGRNFIRPPLLYTPRP